MRDLLSIRAFRFIYAGVAISSLGDATLLLIPAIIAKSITGSDGAAGITFFFSTLPICCGSAFGYIIDRVNHKTLLISTCLLSVIAISPLILVDRTTYWIVYLVATAMGCSYVVIYGTLNAMLRSIVPSQLLADANGLIQSTVQGLRIAGSILGLIIYSNAGPASIILFDAITFVLAAGMFTFVPARTYIPQLRTDRWIKELLSGFQYIVADPVIRRMAVAFSMVCVVSGITESLIFAVIDQGLGRNPDFLTVTSAAMGVGSIVGGALGALAIKRRGEVFSMGLGIIIHGIAISAWLITNELSVLTAMLATGVGLTMSRVARQTLLQRNSPEHLIGRVYTAFDSMGSAALLISLAFGAALVSLLDFRALVVVVGAVTLFAGVYAISTKAIESKV
jgi:MFS family permease